MGSGEWRGGGIWGQENAAETRHKKVKGEQQDNRDRTEYVDANSDKILQV
jgi:hypothetical protein